ncbi:MAG TPA: hypothetical protein PK294_01885 [Ignavibacteria bacterium]|nr:hypothetical protein [Ignavibacteria bacterium]HQY51379.1 hypothetical protein [Ignavibacteria bacterium]HRA99165.1 hypothetical protein [Ignavibacteria bacterium]
MNIQENSDAVKLIKEIRNKLSELERMIGKKTTANYTYPMNNQQHTPPRKRNVYKNSDKKNNK